MNISFLLTLALWWAGAAATIVGFNYGANYTNGSYYEQSDFQRQFAAAKKLTGTDGMFAAARLYTTIQGKDGSDPTSAIPAAVDTKTRLLLGMWASSGSDTIQSEITALKAAIKKYGSEFTNLVEGISVGSEDLYRTTETSLSFDPQSKGASPDEIVGYIKQLREALKGTGLSEAKIGHVDTWTAWVNSSNSAVIEACDWIGTDIYPYYQVAQENGIDIAKGLYDSAWQQNKDAAKGKEIWLTETGWPTAGKTLNKAIPNTDNAQKYWQDVGCGELFGKVNTYWYTYFTDESDTKFGLVDQVSGQPKFDLSCDKATNTSSSPPSTVSAIATGTASSTGTPNGGNSARVVNLAGVLSGVIGVFVALNM